MLWARLWRHMAWNALLRVLGSLVPAGKAGTPGSAGPWLPGGTEQGWEQLQQGQHSHSHWCPAGPRAHEPHSWEILWWKPGFMDLASSLSCSRAFISLFELSSVSSQSPLFALYPLFLVLLHPTCFVNHPWRDLVFPACHQGSLEL